MSGNLIVMKGVRFTEKRLKQWLKEDGKVWVDTKRDEFRCLVSIQGGDVHYFTASGKGEHFNIPHEVDDVFLDLHKETGWSQWDVGLMVNDSFDLTRRTLKASNKSYDLTGGTHHTIIEKATKAQKALGIEDKTIHDGPLRLMVWLYDLPQMDDRDYQARRLHCLHSISRHPAWMRMPEGEWVSTVADAWEAFSEAVENKHEGLMVKRMFHKWVPTRTTDWMKMKPGDERDGVITRFVPGKDGFEGMVGSVSVKFVDGSETDAGGMTLPVRIHMTTHPEDFVGQIACVKYMQRDTQGGYRHPVFVKLHEDKTRIEQCD